MENKIAVYTDGACSGNPGPGGWGSIIIRDNHQEELSGFEANTTNNRMELTAVIKGLSKLGKSVVKILEENNILIDTAHLSRKAFKDFSKITTKPIFFHS